MATLAEFAGSEDGDGLRLANAFVLAEVADGHLSDGVEVVFAVVQYLLHQFNSTRAWCARANEYSQQFCIAECLRPFVAQFLTRLVVFCPMCDCKFFHIDLKFLGFVLFVECPFERIEFVLFKDATLPPCFDEAETVAHQLDEGGGDAEQTYPETFVSDRGINKDDAAIE